MGRACDPEEKGERAMKRIGAGILVLILALLGAS